MLKTEEYCLAKGFKTSYLTTHDQQIFYSRCGYKFSEAVCAFGGSSSLNLGNFASQPSPQNLPTPQPPPLVSNSSRPVGGGPPPPPPPPPPATKPSSQPGSMSVVSSPPPDLVSLCEGAYSQPSLPASLPLIENVPDIDMKLRNQKNNEDSNEKMFMKKHLLQ